MDISAIAGPGGIGGAASGGAPTSVEKEAFLKLLVAQVGNQDPLAPQGTEQFVQQLTQFSTLEQLMNLNSGMNNLALGQLSNNSQEAVRFVGREVIARGDAVALDGAGPVPVRYSVEPEAETVTLTIYPEGSDEPVRQVQVDGSRGDGTFDWDGTDDLGRPVVEGRYRVSIEATDAEGTPLTADTFVRGLVTGVRFDNGYPELMIGDRRLRMSDVIEAR
ncbi:MAG: flagellar hook assembly protein FlgD [Myxococcales bacterium]|nr:flagellar hook assembly protein FlgD [Myxococcales bacterium]